MFTRITAGGRFANRILIVALVGLLIWLPAVPARALSVADEEELGRKYRAAMFHYLDFFTDPVLKTYLSRVGDSLAVHYGKIAYKPEFHLLDDFRLNAFAAPAGVIVISRGLIEKFDCVDELAGVLAHELAHSSERHLAAAMERATKMAWATLAGFVAAALVGAATGSAEAGTGLIAGTIAASQQASLAYSRVNERDADQVGIAMMLKSGYDQRGSLTSLEKLKKATELSRVAAPAYLSTHPALNDRIDFLSAVKDPRPPGSVSPNCDDWPWFRARLAVESGNKDYQKGLKGVLADYARGLKALRAGRTEEALPILAGVYRAEPERLGTAYSYALALHRLGRSEEAAQTLERLLPRQPGDQAALLLLGEINLELGRFDRAVSRFKEVQKLWPAEPQVYHRLGLAYGRAGDLYQAHMNLAEAYVLTADRTRALRNFSLAERHAGSREQKAALERKRDAALKILPPPPSRS